MSTKSKFVRIAVVGAGVSGLACAQQLSAAGFSTVVIDKGRHPGGRLASRERQPQFDYGAQYFTVSDLGFEEIVASWQAEGIVMPWQGHAAVAKKEKNGDCFSLASSTPRKQRYVAVPQMNALGFALAAKLSPPAALLVEHRVTEINFDRASFEILGERAGHVNDIFALTGFDYLVLNLPPMQAAALVASSESLTVPVQASSSFKIVSQVELSPCFALMLQFAQPLVIDFDAIKVTNSLLAWAARDSSKPGRIASQGDSWVLHANPEWSRLHLEDSLDDVGAAMLAELALLNNQELPTITFSKCHRWRYALPQSPLTVGALFDDLNKIGYCGDWCQGNNIEAAFLSGRHLASLIIQDAN